MEETIRTRSRLFRAGIVLIVTFSLVCGLLNIGVFYLFALPVIPVLIGLILVWISNEPAKKKVLISLLPLPVMLTGFLLFIWTLPKAEPEMFLLRSDFRGPFAVLFVEGCGTPIPIENGYRIYHIPPSGVLLHSGNRTLGILDRRFFLIGPDGSRTDMPEFHYSSFDAEASSMKWRFSEDGLTKETVGAFSGYRTYFSFVISNYAELERQTDPEEEGAWKHLRQKIDEELKDKNCPSLPK